MSNNFNLERNFSNVGDIQKTWQWDLFIPDFSRVSGIMGMDDLKLRVRSVTIPSRGVSTIISNWHGMEQVFAGKPNFTHSINVLCEEFDDQNVIKSFYNWQNMIFDIRQNGAPNPGGS